MAGMVEYCDFVEQETVASPGGALRPDMVVRLPGGRNIVVDSKTPLAAYLDAVEAQDDEVRAARLADHARQVRDHMTKLSAKGYQDRITPTPEFVVMFLPGEAFFSAALSADPSLIEYGVGNRVIIATPTTLIALLKAVAYGWRQEQSAGNVERICELARELHERVAPLAEHVERLGRSLDGAVEHYNKFVGSMERNFLPQARRFADLGVPCNRDIPALEAVDKACRAPQAGDLKAVGERKQGD
jgi:DNA recombination protein RmuC